MREMQIASSRVDACGTVQPSFIERMTALCDCVLDDWLRTHEGSRDMAPIIMTRIVDTVRSVFLKDFYRDTSLLHLAQLAQVTEGSIYRLFGDRGGLSHCVLADTLIRIANATEKLIIERGISGFTMKDVADAVGLPENELALLFSTMEHLIATVQSMQG